MNNIGGFNWGDYTPQAGTPRLCQRYTNTFIANNTVHYQLTDPDKVQGCSRVDHLPSSFIHTCRRQWVDIPNWFQLRRMHYFARLLIPPRTIRLIPSVLRPAHHSLNACSDNFAAAFVQVLGATWASHWWRNRDHNWRWRE